MEQMMAGDLHGDRFFFNFNFIKSQSQSHTRAGDSSVVPSLLNRFSCTRKTCCAWCPTVKMLMNAGIFSNCPATRQSSHAFADAFYNCPTSGKQHLTVHNAGVRFIIFEVTVINCYCTSFTHVYSF
jgi:hypothetical protein